MSRFEPQNTLQQDIFLYAKNNYPSDNHDRVADLKIIIGVHIHVNAEHLRAEAVLLWLLKEFVETGVIFKTKEALVRFLFQPDPHWRHRATSAYEERMINGLLDTVQQLQVREDSPTGLTWISEIPECAVDSNLSSLLRTSLAIREIQEIARDRENDRLR